MSNDSDVFTGYHDFPYWGFIANEDACHGPEAEEARELFEEKKEATKRKQQKLLEHEKLVLEHENLVLLTKLTSKCKSTDEIKSAVIRFSIKETLNSSIGNYCSKEKLPHEFVHLPRSPNSLYQIILQHLKIMKVPLSYDDILKFQTLSERLIANLNENTIYDRVGAIQSEIHTLAEGICDGGSSKILDKSIMRQLLSTCRLNLNIQDLSNKSAKYIVEQLQKNDEAADVERIMSTQSKVNGTIKNWKIRHLRSLLWYAPQTARECIEQLLDISTELDTHSFLKKSNQVILGRIEL